MKYRRRAPQWDVHPELALDVKRTLDNAEKARGPLTTAPPIKIVRYVDLVRIKCPNCGARVVIILEIGGAEYAYCWTAGCGTDVSKWRPA